MPADPARDLVDAIWLPGYSVELHDGTVVEPGSTHKVPAGEAKESDNWKPVRPGKAPKTEPDPAPDPDPDGGEK